MILKKIFMIFIICTLLNFMLAESAISSENCKIMIGKLTCVPNPCTNSLKVTIKSTEDISDTATVVVNQSSTTSTICIPGMVWAIETHIGSNYFLSILYFNGSWRWCDGNDLQWKGYIFKEGDLVNVIFKDLNVENIILIGFCTSELVYGEDSEEVKILRHFRDNILNQTPEGQELINLYYQWSPEIVKAMEKDEEFKEEVKEMIDGVLGLVGREVE